MKNVINSSTWDCSHCYKKNNSINNFCKCLMSFYCIKCCKESNVNYTKGQDTNIFLKNDIVKA